MMKLQHLTYLIFIFIIPFSGVADETKNSSFIDIAKSHGKTLLTKEEVKNIADPKNISSFVLLTAITSAPADLDYTNILKILREGTELSVPKFIMKPVFRNLHYEATIVSSGVTYYVVIGRTGAYISSSDKHALINRSF